MEELQLRIIRKDIDGKYVFVAVDESGREVGRVQKIKFTKGGAKMMGKKGTVVFGSIDFMFQDENDDLPCGEYELTHETYPHSNN